MNNFQYVDEYKLEPQKIIMNYEEYWLVKGDINGHVRIIKRGLLPFLAYDYYHNDCNNNPLYKIVKMSMKLEHICTEEEIRAGQKELDNW